MVKWDLSDSIGVMYTRLNITLSQHFLENLSKLCHQTDGLYFWRYFEIKISFFTQMSVMMPKMSPACSEDSRVVGRFVSQIFWVLVFSSGNTLTVISCFPGQKITDNSGFQNKLGLYFHICSTLCMPSIFQIAILQSNSWLTHGHERRSFPSLPPWYIFIRLDAS